MVRQRTSDIEVTRVQCFAQASYAAAGNGSNCSRSFSKPLADGLLVTAQFALPPLLALEEQIRVERLPGGESRGRPHEVPPHVPHLPLVPGAGTSELLREQVLASVDT